MLLGSKSRGISASSRRSISWIPSRLLNSIGKSAFVGPSGKFKGMSASGALPKGCTLNSGFSLVSEISASGAGEKGCIPARPGAKFPPPVVLNPPV